MRRKARRDGIKRRLIASGDGGAGPDIREAAAWQQGSGRRQQIPSQAGKTALITGANSGIGYQAALELARHGAHVLLGCRNEAKGRAALERLLREAPGASAEVVQLDMASLASIRAFAAAFIGRGVALDLLINNAGVMALPKRELTADGFERQLGTNHLGHFALTGLLLPALLAAPAPRVVTVASLAHRTARSSSTTCRASVDMAVGCVQRVEAGEHSVCEGAGSAGAGGGKAGC